MLIPASELALGFQSGGVLAEVLVEMGDQVEAGQLLARLDSTDAQDQVAQAEISLYQAELDLPQFRLRLVGPVVVPTEVIFLARLAARMRKNERPCAPPLRSGTCQSPPNLHQISTSLCYYGAGHPALFNQG
jgi:multidrug efflux pump subunit AcrA (membrane-fusion protein)